MSFTGSLYCRLVRTNTNRAKICKLCKTDVLLLFSLLAIIWSLPSVNTIAMNLMPVEVPVGTLLVSSVRKLTLSSAMNPSHEAALRSLWKNGCTHAAVDASVTASHRYPGSYVPPSKNARTLVSSYVLLGMLQQIWDAEILATPSSCYFCFILTFLVYHFQF